MSPVEIIPSITLEGQQAIGLWKKGKDAWYKWVEKNPTANVSFGNSDFHKLLKEGTKADFRESIFLKGSVSFKGTQFGNADVNFEKELFI